jgi:hypothetical protein
MTGAANGLCACVSANSTCGLADKPVVNTHLLRLLMPRPDSLDVIAERAVHRIRL